MKIDAINVNGTYGFNYNFHDKNVLLGANATGKSTLVKLILYALGVDIPDFIQEIAEDKLSESVCLRYITKTDKMYSVVRKLPFSDVVMVTPFNYENNCFDTAEIQVLNLEEYSNFLLEEEGYSGEKISYGDGKLASLRYKFLLRTAIVDQGTEHRKILANIGASNDYIASQTVINKAIIEKILRRNNEEVQTLRLELNEKTKRRKELVDKKKIYDEMIKEYKESDEKWPMKIGKIQEEMDKIDAEKDELSVEKYQVLLKLDQQSDKQKEKNIVNLRKEINTLKETLTKSKLELIDIEGILEKLSSELSDIKKNIVAKKIIQNIPVTICPVCFSEIEVQDEKGLCENCNQHNQEEILQSLAMYKKMIDESYTETKSLKKERIEAIQCLNATLVKKQKKLGALEKQYYEKLSSLKEPLQILIQEIKNKIEELTDRHYKLANLKKNIVEINKIDSALEMLGSEIKQLRKDLDDASEKSQDDLNILVKWKKEFSEIFSEIGCTEDKVEISEDDYMPLVNGNTMNKVSSESMKVVVRLSYILSLYKLQNCLENEKINNIGFVIFDSPKDKDLDRDKYERFLKCLAETNCGQIFLTGSDRDEIIYAKAFRKEDFLPRLSDDNKLLKKLC